MREDLMNLSGQDLLGRFMTARHRVSMLTLAQSIVGEEIVDKSELARWEAIQNALYDELRRRLALVPPDAK